MPGSARAPAAGNRHPALYRQLAVARSGKRFEDPQVPFKITHSDYIAPDERLMPPVERHDVLGPIFEDDVPVITDTGPENFFAAVQKRVNHYDTGKARKTYEASLHLLDELLPTRCEEFVFTEEFFNDWNSHNSPSKQKKMLLALEEFSRFTPAEFAKKDIFTKCEVLLKRHDEDWAGRLVNNSTDLHNAISGPYLQASTKRLNNFLDNRGHSSHAYHLAYGGTTDKIADIINSAGRPVDMAVECDFSGNDMRQVCTAQACEGEWLYRLGTPRWLTDVMAGANRYKVYNRNYGFSATVSFQLPSGSTSTTFRNCVWNLSIFHQWVIEHRVQAFVVFVLGDDMVALIFDHRFGNGNKRLRNASRSYEHVARSAHMKAKVKAWEHLSQAEFLSKCFIITSSGFRLMPKLGRAFAKFNVRANKNQAISDNEYMAGKALSYAWEYRYCPFIRDRLLDFVTATQIDWFEISAAALSHNFGTIVRELGRKAALRTILVKEEDEISDDDLSAFLSFRYGPSVWNTDLASLLDSLLFGVEDIPRMVYETYARVDYWN